MYNKPGICFHQFPGKFFQGRTGKLSRGHCQRPFQRLSSLMIPGILNSCLISLGKLLHQKPHHPHAVLQLYIPVITLFLREFPSRQNIELITGMNEMQSILIKASLLIPLNHINNLFCFLFHKQFDRIQSLSESADACRHHRHTAHKRQIRHQIHDTAAKLLPVIDSLAAHDLSVHLHMPFIKHLQELQFFSCETIVQHHTPQFGICGLHRDIDGRKLHLDNPLHILLRHIGQCNIIAL